jgi:hypothetical protein
MKKLEELLKESMTNNTPQEAEYESKTIPETDAMGREKFWEDIGRPND